MGKTFLMAFVYGLAFYLLFSLFCHFLFPGLPYMVRVVLGLALAIAVAYLAQRVLSRKQ